MKKKSKKISKKKTSSVSYDDDALTDDTVNDDDAPPNTRRASPDYAEFARAWTNSSTVTEVADKLGIKRNSAAAIAGRLRKNGVDLKKYARKNAQPIDVKKLNRIAAGKED